MTREPGLDDRTVDWLCAGPERAPDWVLSAVDAHARAHPHRGRYARTLVSRLHLVRAGERTGAGRLSNTWAAVASMAAVVVVAGALAVGSAWNGWTPVVTGPATTAQTGAGTEEPVALAGTCHPGGNAVDTLSGGVTRTRGGWLACTITSTDPRLAGTATIYLSIDRRATGDGDAWGDATFRSAGGRWSGPFSGSLDPDGTQHLTGVLFGADAYAASRIRFEQTGTTEAFALQGTLEPAGSLSAAGGIVVRRLTCLEGGDPGTESMDPTGVNHVQGRSMRCMADASDPRLSGETTLVAEIDAQPDDSARIRGTESLLTGEGAWTGTWMGTYDIGWTTHRWTGTLQGSGANAGLEFVYSTIGEWPRFVQTGVIVQGS